MSNLDELKKLAELRESGVLTEEEFQEQKEVLLAEGSSSTNAPEFSELDGHRKWTLIGLAICCAAILNDYGIIQQYIDLFSRAASGVDIPMAEANALDEKAEKFSGLFLLTVIFTAVFFVRWMMAAYRNVQTISDSPVQFSNSQAGWAFFIPFINLIRPYKIITEIWNASSPDSDGSNSGGGASKLVGFWWTTWLMGGITSRIGAILVQDGIKDTDLEMVNTGLRIGRAGNVILLISGILAFILVKRLSAYQKEKISV